MGQRTQIVVKVNEHDKYTKTTKTRIASYHNQWGIAKMQLMDAINLLNTYIDGEFKFPKQLAKAWLLDKEDTCKDTSIKGVIDYLNHMDNNDGGLYIELEIEDYDISKGKMYIFNDAEVEGQEVNRVVSLAEYISYYPRYYDSDFYTMFTACLRFHNVQLIEEYHEND